MADIAAIFHWSRESLEALDMFELLDWRQRAVARWNRMNRVKGAE
ncbi:MAG TPA: GpE family phage tail protein [Sphingopyxis sp.]|nr:GpE family phage tail protein [Sphingopyxis sp.]